MACKFLLFSLSCLIVIQSMAQSGSIINGKNAAAGRYYAIRGFRLYTESYGKGTPVLLIHGNGGSINAFTPTIPYLSKKYKVIAADSRAQGKSTDFADSLSFEQMADDYAVLLDSLHMDKVDVIGWSDGGIIALLLAIRHPEKINRLVSSGANCWPDSTALIPSGWMEDKQYYEKHKRTVWQTPQEKNNWKIFLLDWMQPNISLPSLEQIHCPSLIVSGDKDVIRLEHTVAIYQHIPEAELWVLPHSGHATLREHSQAFNQQVDAFFSE